MATTTKLATQETGMVGRAEATCWIPPAEMTHEQWTQIGNTFQQIDESINWWLGDWLNEGEKRYGETYSQAVKYTSHKLEKLKQCKWVAGAIEPYRRRASLSWTHHRYVAYLAPNDQDRWLRRAQNEGMSTAALLAALRLAEGKNTDSRTPYGTLSRNATPKEAATWLSLYYPLEWRQKLAALLLD